MYSITISLDYYKICYSFVSYTLYRQERDLYSRKDQFGVELRERAKWDLRQAMVGTETFMPKHIVIATWKNVSFAGGIPQARRIVREYIIYINYRKNVL